MLRGPFTTARARLYRYFVSVTATNGAGLSSTAHAVPLLVDSSPPTAVAVSNVPPESAADPSLPAFSSTAQDVHAGYEWSARCATCTP